MLSRSAPMKRKGFARPVYERKPRQACRLERVPAPSEPVFRPQPKTVYVDDEGYRRAVAALPCYRCGVVGFSNACHSDAGGDGKGLGIKACDLTCWPGCVARPGIPGCHAEVGTLAVLSRAAREEFERRAAAATQATLIAQSEGDPKLRAILVRVGLCSTWSHMEKVS